MNKVVGYFTYQELLDMVNIEDVQMPQYPHDVNMSSNWFTALIEVGGLEFAVYTLDESFTDDLLNDIVNAVMGVVYNRHAKDFIAKAEYDPENGYDLEQLMMEALSKLINVIDLTLPKYVPILQQNEYASVCPITPNIDESSEESSSETSSEYSSENSSSGDATTRRNDTPQNGGDYSDDEHTSEISQDVNSSSGSTSGDNSGDYSSKTTRRNTQNIGTLMSRLDEMYKGFRSIILEWSNEFNMLFLKEEQL